MKAMRRRHAALGGALLGLAGAAGALGLFLAAGGCSGGSSGGGGGDAGTTTTLHPDAPPLPGETACTVVEVTEIPVESGIHIPDCAPLSYATNPPSGGPHWPIWAAYREYTVPVPREMYVHGLEHGAVVLAYRCQEPCPDVVAMLSKVFDGMQDPLCLQIPGGPAARVVLTPDPLLDTPIAAAAWGATYTATCLDEPSLRAFVNAHYGQGPEVLCADGQDVEDGIDPCGHVFSDAGTPPPSDGGADADGSD
jgi:hypothetical protein